MSISFTIKDVPKLKTVRKKIIIEKCSECPHCNYSMCGNKIVSAVCGNSVVWKQIKDKTVTIKQMPVWCPLEDE